MFTYREDLNSVNLKGAGHQTISRMPLNHSKASTG